MPAVMDRVHAVAIHRKKSKRQTTKKLAKVAACFGEIRQPDRRVPADSLGVERTPPLHPDRIHASRGHRQQPRASGPGGELYHFGVLSSAMHMAWVRQVAGRLESRYRYSNRIVYNNYPWPAEPTAAAAAASKRRRNGFWICGPNWGTDGPGSFPGQRQPTACLADLYNREGMPPAAATRRMPPLDRAVNRCYRRQPFTSDRQRIEFLFALYEAIAAPLIPTTRQRQR